MIDRERKVVHTRKTNRAHKSNVYDVLVTEAGGTEIYPVLGWDGKDLPDRGRWKEGHLLGE